MVRTPILWLVALGLPGCATITTGTNQSLSVVTDPPGATCRLQRGGELIGVVSPTPGSVHIDKSVRAISVECSRAGYQNTASRVPPNFQPMFVGNILIGGIIG